MPFLTFNPSFIIILHLPLPYVYLLDIFLSMMLTFVNDNIIREQ